MEEAAEGEDMGGLFGDDYDDEEYCESAVMKEAEIKPQSMKLMMRRSSPKAAAMHTSNLFSMDMG
jgi:hypothetical protein